MLRVRLGSHVTRNFKERGIVYHPDFIIYDIDKAEYRTFWTNIYNHPRNRLYTDGIQVIPVGWLQTLFQSIKGWLGFENRCAPDKVEMTLAKIAYHGYTKGFHLPETQAQIPSLISQRYETLIAQPRNDENSAELQQLLLSYYNTRSEQITPWYASGPAVTSFGQTFNREDQYHLIPSLDPQDKIIISNAIHGLHYYNLQVNSRECFKDSRFAKAYAEHLVYQGEYAQALAWHEAIKYNYLEPYINYYLSQRNALSNTLKQAIELLELLFQSPRIEDKNKSVTYLREHLDKSEQLTFLQPDSKLRRQLAQTYLHDAKVEKNKFSITKLFFGNDLIPLLAHTIRLSPDILNNDQSMEDIVLKEEWTTYLFNEAIKDNRFLDARNLFESHQSFKFDKYNLELLKSNYLAELAAKKRSVKNHLYQSNCPKAEQAAKEIVMLAQKIATISPEENPLLAVTIDYAGTLIEIDKILCPDIKKADLERLGKAQKLLNSCSISKNTPSYKHRFNELLLRKIYCLIEKVRVPIDFDDSLSTRKEFLPTVQPWLELLQQNLSSFIALNEHKPTKEMRAVLGKMHYLKGDVIYFFTRNRQEALPYFKKAAEVMPENPYYRLRHFELANDERRNSVYKEIDEMAFLNTENYNMWMTERWNDERHMSEGFDIHNIQPKDMGVLSKFSRLFGS